jgi:hypothetical protein
METDSRTLRCRVGAVDSDWPGSQSRSCQAFERVIHEVKNCQLTATGTILQKDKLASGTSSMAGSG